MNVATAPMPTPREHHRNPNRALLSRLVAERPWDWIRELCAPLKLDVEILDAALRPQLQPSSSILLSVAPLEGSWAEAAKEAIRSRLVQHVAAEGAVAVMAPLLVSAEAVGVLVLVHNRPRRMGQRSGTPDRLIRLGAWLASAASRHLGSAAAEVEDLTPLIRLLAAGSPNGSDRELIATFAEAMAIWHDIEVVGFVEVRQSTYAREVALGGRTGSRDAVTLSDEAIPAPLTLSPLSAADAEGLVPSTSPEALAATLTRRHGTSRWLLVFTGATQCCDAQRLLNYVAVLDMAVGQLIGAVCADVAANALRHDPVSRPSMRAGLGAVLSDVSTRLAADAVALIVEFPTLPAPIRIGSIEALTKPRAFDRSRLVVVRRGTSGEAVLLGVHRPVGGDFTPLERLIVETAAENILTWGARDVRPSQDEPPSSAVLERLAQEALEHGSTVTAVVVVTSNPAQSRSPNVPVDQIRRGLRQSDEVRLLRSGELGLLLRDATAASAAAVTKRLQAALRQSQDGAAISVRTIGFETRLPGTGAIGIVQAARSNAKYPVDAR